mmetsp:Transcript_27878/g.42162  ORF Transcript_27878/g.42162 Transcript_27878/m.42162 type:complete len:256 (+) Transcript_27878:298-1065(+)
MMQYLKRNNEIIDVIYVGKVEQAVGGQSKQQLREFIVRRKRSLETLLTNGLFQWTNYIENAMVNSPLFISDLSFSGVSLLVTYSSTDMNQKFIRLFRRNSEEKFVLVPDHSLSGRKNLENILMDSDGDAFEVFVHVVKVSKGQSRKGIKTKHTKQAISVSIPETILFDELLGDSQQWQRLVPSADGRIILCGKIMLKMGKDLDEVEDIGFISMEKMHSSMFYKFHSLLSKRKDILNVLHSKEVVDFKDDNQPICP